MRSPTALLAFVIALASTAHGGLAQMPAPAPGPVEDARPAAPAPYAVPEPAPNGAIRRESRYLTMRDGTKIAIDVWRPKRMAGPAPTLIQQTRYWRSPEVRFPFSLFVSPLDHQGVLGTLKRRMLAAGYVWIDVDTRGSGASFGSRPWDYSPDEIQDGGEVIDWIVRQPWSDGKVATAGASYSGSTAEFALINRREAVQAIVPVSSEFDQYTDILAPGGVPLTFYLDDWGALTGALDRNEIPDADWKIRLASGGVAPVDGDLFALQRGRAVKEHRDNYDFRELKKTVFRDDLTVEAGPGASPGRLNSQASSFKWLEDRLGPGFRARGIDLASTHAYLDDLKAANGPVYAVSGWLDGPYANAAAKRFNTYGRPGDKLLIGPWDHLQRNISPYSGGAPTGFDLLAEVQKFIDGTVGGKPEALQGEAPVHYYVMGAETWRASKVWPPASTTTRLWLGERRALTTAAPAAAGRDRYVVDYEATTGNRTRWDTLMAIPLRKPYPDRAKQDERLLVFDGPVLSADTEVTGHPLVELWLTSTAGDGAFFVYLEDVRPDGTVVYVTEGQLRALHRKEQTAPAPTWQAGPYRTYRRADAQPITPGEPFRLTFDLLPTSYVFKAGSRIRVAIAGADKAHFARVPADPAVTPVIELLREPGRASWIELPVVTASAPAD